MAGRVLLQSADSYDPIFFIFLSGGMGKVLSQHGLGSTGIEYILELHGNPLDLLPPLPYQLYVATIFLVTLLAQGVPEYAEMFGYAALDTDLSLRTVD